MNPESPLPPVLTPSTAPRKPWGFWKVIGGTVLALLVTGIAPVAITVAAIALTEHSATGVTPARLEASQFSLAGWIGVAFAAVACWILARGCGRGSPRAVLGLQAVKVPVLLKWCGVALVLCVVNDGVLLLAGRPIVHESMLEIYRSVESKLMLLLVVNLQAPFIEELIMRGFCLEGLRHTKVGQRGAILLSALIWAVLHVQYELIGISQILVGGLVYGVARIRTGSILPTIAMHAINNLWSTVELLLVV